MTWQIAQDLNYTRKVYGGREFKCGGGGSVELAATSRDGVYGPVSAGQGRRMRRVCISTQTQAAVAVVCYISLTTRVHHITSMS